MSPLALSRNFFLLSALAMTVPVLSAAEAPWPVAPSFVEMPTPYGTLSVSSSEYVYEATLLVNGKAVQPEVKGLISLSYAFSLPDRQATLVSVSRGNDTCPVSYLWVVLKKTGYDISPEFGSCSEQIRVAANGRQLTLTTPSRNTPGQVDVYVYDGKKIVKKKGK